ncbi:type II secretion system GspH family protein [Pseudomonas stutzeri]|uniref:Type II secretion system protein n=1 Tax=Stutzerimonas stutzeri TaxID=316 RepID=A0A2N8S633_STUST|nr:type II secretion system protein [Stutzerimonas stutzeri]MCQ4297060.1 type II secretion system GspH family protein [Stutzerimonas stutzeri]PNF82069.1 type II secretion system protein [Stutzerimonas stutzeri]
MGRVADSKGSARTDARGFTLVELIMVIALAGVVAVMLATVLNNPMQSFVDQSRRAELVDLAATALNRMARDVRLGVPNTLRARDSQTLELLLIDQAGRYRANQHGGAGVRFDPPRCPPSSACSIEVLSPGVDSVQVAAARWMVIYNIGTSSQGDSVWPPFNQNASTSAAVITPSGVSFSHALGALTLGGTTANNFRFKFASPQHRFYLVRDVVGYRCDGPGTDAAGNGTGVIRRATFGSLAATYGYSAANSAVLVDSVAACQFSYAPGTSTRGGLVSIRLTLKKNNEEIVLLQQVHVDNAP